jgi:hypothetical protein
VAAFESTDEAGRPTIVPEFCALVAPNSPLACPFFASSGKLFTPAYR